MTERFRLRRGGIEWRQVEGEVVALDLEHSNYLSANHAGSALWAALAEGATRDELVAQLRDAYDIDEATARRDVDAFLDSLKTQGLLES